jgi:predicted  nucleic acid-binding Zn-ribbon protein
MISQKKLDNTTWMALARAFRIAEEVLSELSLKEPRCGWPAREALDKMKAEVEACNEDASR